MTEAQRKEARARVKKLASDARKLAAGWNDDHAPIEELVAVLADEVAKILAPTRQRRRPSRRHRR